MYYYLPPEIFAREGLGFVPIPIGFLTLLLTFLIPLTLRRFLKAVQSPISGSLRRLQATLANLAELEVDISLEVAYPVRSSAAFGLPTVNVAHTVKTKGVALRQLL